MADDTLYNECISRITFVRGEYDGNRFLNDARREIEGRTEDFYGELKAFYQGNKKQSRT